MIYESLTCLADEINDYFRQKLKINEDKVVLSAIINQDGTVAIQGENKVIITLINVEKEPTAINASGGGGRTLSNSSSPMSINLYVLFASYFSSANYPEAVRFISFIISFLQERSVFSQSNTPRLPAGVDKITLELESMGFEKLNNIWGMLGAKYLPSVVYKMRMLTFDTSVMREYRPPISQASDGK